jgi:hypothetical protein
MSVHKKLMEARMALHSREIKKSGWNDFSKYKYMELADFLVPTLKIWNDIGLCGVVSFTADVATLTITDTEDGTNIYITSPMGSANLKACHEVQNIGAVETYQRRYLYGSAMEIVEHDAIDSAPPAESLEPLLKASIEQAKQKKAGVMNAVLADIHLDAATELALAKLAKEVTGMAPDLGYDRIEMEELNSDERLYLWSLLDSKVRSALKREKDTRALMSTKETA